MPTLKEMYLLPFKALAAATRVFIHNRNRTKAFIRKPVLANVIKYGMLATLLVWLLIALLNRDENDDRLNNAIKDLWSKTSGETSQGIPEPEK